MRTWIFATTMALALVFMPAVYAADHEDKDTDDVNLTVESFLNKLHAGNLKEIDMAKMAVSKSNNEDVKEFAEMLQRDHKAADDKVKQLASAKSITLKDPVMHDKSHSETKDSDEARSQATDETPSQSVDADHADKAKHDKTMLESLSGDEFNREYTMMMTKSHNKTLALLDKAATKFDDDAQVKALVSELKPIVRGHAERATQFARQFGGNPDQTDRETNR